MGVTLQTLKIGGSSGRPLSRAVPPPGLPDLDCAEHEPRRTCYMHYDHSTCIYYNHKHVPCPTRLILWGIKDGGPEGKAPW